MRKSVLIGVVLGLVALALIAIGTWAIERYRPLHAGLGLDKTEPSSYADLRSGLTENSSSKPGGDGGLPTPAPNEGTKERRKRLLELRAEFNMLRSQGLDASAERLAKVVDDLESLSPSDTDPRYYASLRKMLEINAQIQHLNKELKSLSLNVTPQSDARKKAILDELNKLGADVIEEARNLQKYSPSPSAEGKSP